MKTNTSNKTNNILNNRKENKTMKTAPLGAACMDFSYKRLLTRAVS